MKKALKMFAGMAMAFCVIFATSVPSFAYTVKEGDTLNDIAKANGISIDEIEKLNPKIGDIDMIFPGQEINLKKDYYHRAKLTNAEKKAINSLFDYEYYKETNKDVVEQVGDSEAALWEHFLNYGLWETRQPNKDFNVNAYASAYDDVRGACVSEDLGEMVKKLVLHYAEIGKSEGRTTTTIEACINEGKDVLYYGGYDDETPTWVEEHLIAEVKKSEEAPKALSYRQYFYGVMRQWFADYFVMINNSYPNVIAKGTEDPSTNQDCGLFLDRINAYNDSDSGLEHWFGDVVVTRAWLEDAFEEECTEYDITAYEGWCTDFYNAILAVYEILGDAYVNPEACPYEDLKSAVYAEWAGNREEVDRILGNFIWENAP